MAVHLVAFRRGQLRFAFRKLREQGWVKVTTALAEGKSAYSYVDESRDAQKREWLQKQVHEEICVVLNPFNEALGVCELQCIRDKRVASARQPYG